MASGIGDLRRKIALGYYELTGHAKDEMEQDRFTVRDVKSAFYTGRIIGTQRHGRGQRKFVVAGKAEDDRLLQVVCRLTSAGRLRIITLFSV